MITKLNIDFSEYLRKIKEMDYLMIDPPWNYGMKGSKLQTTTASATDYEYWSRNNQFEVEKILDSCQKVNVKAIAMWTTLPMLSHVMSATYDHEYYDFRSMITWVKKYASGKDASVMAHYFQNTTEFLVIIKAKKPKSEIPRTKIKTNFEGLRRERTIKPKILEESLINSWPGKWAYIFAGPAIDELELDHKIDLVAVDIIY